jgi:hypothetical protein
MRSTQHLFNSPQHCQLLGLSQKYRASQPGKIAGHRRFETQRIQIGLILFLPLGGRARRLGCRREAQCWKGNNQALCCFRVRPYLEKKEKKRSEAINSLVKVRRLQWMELISPMRLLLLTDTFFTSCKYSEDSARKLKYTSNPYSCTKWVSNSLFDFWSRPSSSRLLKLYAEVGQFRQLRSSNLN